MNPFAVALAVVVQFTLPSHLAGPNPCVDVGMLMSDLDSCRVLYQVTGETGQLTAFAGQVHGLEGTVFSVDIPTTQPATVWAQTRRLWSPWSCNSNMFTINAPLSVPPGKARPYKYYDVAGRVIVRPLKPGVYFLRRDGDTESHRIVVIR